MARKTKEDAVKTKESLLDAAEIVFLRRGVAKASLDEIAKEAHVTRGAVYWHFENKLAIFRAMNDRVKLPMDQIFEQLISGGDPLEGLKQLCLHVMQMMEKDIHVRNVFTIVRMRCEDYHCENSDYSREFHTKREQALAKFTRAFKEIAKQHQFAEGVTTEFAAIALHTFISGVFWDYLKYREQFPISKLAPKLIDNFFRGLLVPAK